MSLELEHEHNEDHSCCDHSDDTNLTISPTEEMWINEISQWIESNAILSNLILSDRIDEAKAYASQIMESVNTMKTFTEFVKEHN